MRREGPWTLGARAAPLASAVVARRSGPAHARWRPRARTAGRQEGLRRRRHGAPTATGPPLRAMAQTAGTRRRQQSRSYDGNPGLEDFEGSSKTPLLSLQRSPGRVSDDGLTEAVQHPLDGLRRVRPAHRVARGEPIRRAGPPTIARVDALEPCSAKGAQSSPVVRPEGTRSRLDRCLDRILQALLGLNDLAIDRWLRPASATARDPSRATRATSRPGATRDVVLVDKLRSPKPPGTDEEFRSEPAPYQLRAAPRPRRSGCRRRRSGALRLDRQPHRESRANCAAIDADVVFAVGQLALAVPMQ